MGILKIGARRVLMRDDTIKMRVAIETVKNRMCFAVIRLHLGQRGMSEDSGVFMALQSPGRGRVAAALPVHTSRVLWPPSVIRSIPTSVLHCEVGQSHPGFHPVAFPLMLTFHIQPAEAFSLYRGRYYTSVINPAVCVAARLQDGLSWSTFTNVSASKNNLWGQGLCVFICTDFAAAVSGLKDKNSFLSNSFHGSSPVYVHMKSLWLKSLKGGPWQCLYLKHS